MTVDVASGTAKDSGKTKQVAYYGCNVLQYKGVRRDIFAVMISEEFGYVCQSDRRLGVAPSMIAVEVSEKK